MKKVQLVFFCESGFHKKFWNMALQRPLENMKNDQKWENGENDKKINFFFKWKTRNQEWRFKTNEINTSLEIKINIKCPENVNQKYI